MAGTKTTNEADYGFKNDYAEYEDLASGPSASGQEKLRKSVKFMEVKNQRVVQ